MTSAIKKITKSFGSRFMSFPLRVQAANSAVPVTVITQETNAG